MNSLPMLREKLLGEIAGAKAIHPEARLKATFTDPVTGISFSGESSLWSWEGERKAFIEEREKVVKAIEEQLTNQAEGGTDGEA